MNQQTTLNLREERDFGQKINATFSFIGQHFKPLLTAALLIAGPFFIFGGILMGVFQSALMGIGGDPQPRYTSWGQYSFASQIQSAYYLGSMFVLMIGFTMLALTVYGYMVEYMDRGNRKPTLNQVWDNVKEHMMVCILSTVGAFIMVVAGFVLLVIPGVYLSVMLTLLLIVMVREDLNFIEAVERCYTLIKGHWWATFGLLLVVGIIQGFGSMVFQVPMYIMMFSKAAGLTFLDNKLYMILSSVLATFGNAMLYIFSFTVIGFQYFNLVEKKEGIGYLEQVSKIGQAKPASEEHAW